MEQWKDIPSWEGAYQVSNHGNVRSVDRVVTTLTPNNWSKRFYHGQVLKPTLLTKKGNGHVSKYRTVMLQHKGRMKNVRVGRIVALTFLGDGGPQVRHLDGNSLNDYASNLAWGTQSDNEADKASHGTHNKGSQHNMAKLDEEKVRRIRNRHADGTPAPRLADEFGVSRSTIYYAIQRKTWSHVS